MISASCDALGHLLVIPWPLGEMRHLAKLLKARELGGVCELSPVVIWNHDFHDRLLFFSMLVCGQNALLVRGLSIHGIPQYD